ncbi:hypothetical protein M408DRAFT_333789 [Serendipita vermifera MAFF 305830]|uniref:Uncharacterized protein n=1 Tax=Serendipita vermifera MAFF 305830 TaxID=933852 RepID=A0A0C3A867_SERVB|nr:hypothetical protein M408DRAFT_333789 [Serendipita vermifera MAFF 305830]
MSERAGAKLAGHDSRLNQVLDKLEGVKREILKITLVEILPDATIDDFKPQMKRLRDGLEELNAIKPGVYRVAEGNDAERGDRTMIVQSIQFAKDMKKDSLSSLSLYNMCDPSMPPHTPEVDLTTCKEAKNYLRRQKQVKKPELWREKDRHCSTPQGIRWEHVAKDSTTLTALSLYLDVTPDLANYIVVLRYHRNEDTDIPIAVPIVSTALTLKQHLTDLWPEYMVQGAHKIDDLEDVTLSKIDETLCRDRTNDLFVYVSTHIAKKKRWALWRERWRVAKKLLVRIRGQK